MKIIKRPEIPVVTCEHCGCIFQPRNKDIKIDDWKGTKDVVRCPFCNSKQVVKFKVPEVVK